MPSINRNIRLDPHLEREGRADHGALRIGAAADPDRRVVAVSAAAAARPEQLVVHRIVGDPDLDPVARHIGERDRPVRHAAQEIGGAVDRIDHPQPGAGPARRRAAFLAEQVVVREGAAQALCGSGPRPRGRRRSPDPACPCARSRAARACRSSRAPACRPRGRWRRRRAGAGRGRDRSSGSPAGNGLGSDEYRVRRAAARAASTSGAAPAARRSRAPARCLRPPARPGAWPA